MVQVLSKLSPIDISCKNYVHPWTDSCVKASCSSYVDAFVNSARVYGTLYLLAMLFKGKIPTVEDMKKTAKGVVQSTLFLSTNYFICNVFSCTLRKLLGNFNIATVSFLPAFLASLISILIERPSRRRLLALYMSNIATESIWKMMVTRNMVKTVNSGEVFIFAGSLAVLLTYFKAGLHMKNNEQPDSMFNTLKFVVGPYEEKDFSVRSSEANQSNELETANQRWTCNNARNGENKNVVFSLVMRALKVYKRIVSKIKSWDRHQCCPHPFSCAYYTLHQSTKMVGLGILLQGVLQLIFNMKTIIKSPKEIPTIFLQRKNLNIGTFLGGASGIFTSIMCILRRVRGKDSPIHALPAGLLAGLAFAKCPSNTIALYVFWKLLQISYDLAIDQGYLPEVPHFIILLFAFSTGVSFHSALVEPLTLRRSYWKFLYSITGGRTAVMERKAMDVWGLGTSEALKKTMALTRTEPILRGYF